jgi:alpha-tubulin suppressor-like RCC1 family protein
MVVAWGDNGAGQISVPPDALSDVVAIAAGYEHSLALKADGTVVTWGQDGFGLSTVPEGLGDVVAIAAGGYQSMALTADGRIVAWGADDQTEVPPGMKGVSAVAAGGTHLIALFSDFSQPPTAGQFSTTCRQNSSITISLTDLLRGCTDPDGDALSIIEVSGTSAQDGTIQVLDSNLTYTPAFGFAGGDMFAYWVADSTGLLAQGTVTVTVTAPAFAGSVVGWGSDSYYQSAVPSGLKDVVAISAGTYHSLALRRDGTVVAWGGNIWGQATVPAGLSDVMAISAGTSHNLALKQDGTVVAWGDNTLGQTAVPLGLSDVKAISAGLSHSLALKSEGTVVAWGFGVFGENTVPQGLTDVTAIFAGYMYNVVLKRDGTVVAWGFDDFGRITMPSGLREVTAVALGSYHRVALKKDGTVVAWGDDVFGQLRVPPGLNEVAAISAKDAFTLALKKDGTVVGWGYNSSGQSTSPVGLGGVMAIAAGGLHSLALYPGDPSKGPTAPTISPIANQTIDEDTATAALPFTVGDAQTSAANLTVRAKSSNQSLVLDTRIGFEGQGGNRAVVVRPEANRSGQTTITLAVKDGVFSASTSFLLTVNPVNDPPTITSIPDQTLNPGAGTGPLRFTIGDIDTGMAGLTLAKDSSNPNLIPIGNIVFGGNGGNRTVNVTPRANQSGTARITVTVSDGRATTSTSFLVTVRPAFVGTKKFANTSAINIPSLGTGSLYPSAVNVSGMGGTISAVTLSLNDLSHTSPNHIDMLLVGPGGQKVMVFSDAGNGGNVNGITVTLSDAAGTILPQSTRIQSGLYRPADYEVGDVMPAPAPGGPYAIRLGVFNGLSGAGINGTWRLFVADDTASKSGSLGGGWTLTLTTVD